MSDHREGAPAQSSAIRALIAEPARRPSVAVNMSLGTRLLGPRGSLRRREALTGLASMVPALLLVGFVIWYPVLQTFWYSFTEWNGASSTWLGIDNYQDILRDSEFWTPLKNNA